MNKILLDFELRLIALCNFFDRVTVPIVNRHRLRHIFLLTLGLLICSVTVKGQIIDFQNDKYWFDLGIGSYGSTGESAGHSVNLGANLFKDSTLYKVRFLWNKEFDLLGSNDPSEEFYSAGVMIGKVRSNQYIQFRYSGGIGVIGGVKRGDKLLYTTGSWLKKNYYGEENFITPSIPLELDLIFKPIKHFGIGFAIWGELNYKRPMGGIIFKIEVGKLR